MGVSKNSGLIGFRFKVLILTFKALHSWNPLFPHLSGRPRALLGGQPYYSWVLHAAKQRIDTKQRLIL